MFHCKFTYCFTAHMHEICGKVSKSTFLTVVLGVVQIHALMAPMVAGRVGHRPAEAWAAAADGGD
eukprot:COSAG05_NODE_4531_length_1475_cov_23.828488_1_plen_65_part_00